MRFWERNCQQKNLGMKLKIDLKFRDENGAFAIFKFLKLWCFEGGVAEKHEYLGFAFCCFIGLC